MVEVLERKVGNVISSDKVFSQRKYVEKIGSNRGGKNNNAKYSTFAEIYLEKPVGVRAGPTCTMCTWRGIPTIDDW